jgi:endonuclease/exonuclease/phosphatase (EEP) superfamily protein YafD
MTDVIFFVLTALLVGLTVLPLWRHEAWWVRALDFPRLQLCIASFVLIILQLVLLDLSKPFIWGLLLFATGCLVQHVRLIFPYTPIYPVEVKSANSRRHKCMIRILTANVLMPNRNADTLIKLIRENDPDVLVTLESDMWWQSQLDSLELDYPYTIKCPQDNLYGMHVYSRLSLSESQTDFLVEPDIPSMHTLVTLPSGHQVRAHFLHPAPPSPTEKEESSARDAELIVVAKSVADASTPIIVTGDLNDVAWSETTRLFRKISGLLDPRVGRGMFNTFHANYWFMRWPLDHLFHSTHFTLSRIRRLQRFGSDHFAILAELVLEFESGSDQTGIEANRDDDDWAETKTNAHGVNENDVPKPGGQD